MDDWSVKDLIAHFLLWELWILDRCEQLRESGAVIEDERDTSPTDDMNQLNYERNRLRPFEAIRSEEQEVFARILALVRAFDDDELFEPDRYQFAPGEALANEIENETVNHYRAHSEVLASFISQESGKRP